MGVCICYRSKPITTEIILTRKVFLYHLAQLKVETNENVQEGKEIPNNTSFNNATNKDSRKSMRNKVIRSLSFHEHSKDLNSITENKIPPDNPKRKSIKYQITVQHEDSKHVDDAEKQIEKKLSVGDMDPSQVYKEDQASLKRSLSPDIELQFKRCKKNMV